MIQYYYYNFPKYKTREYFADFKVVHYAASGFSDVNKNQSLKDFYSQRCQCKEDDLETKKERLESYGKLGRILKQFKKTRASKSFQYPEETVNSVSLKQYTFHFKWDQKLSPIVQLSLKSFKNKYLYHAIDDLLEVINYNPKESKHLLDILYSPALLLQNNYSINFFDMFIEKIVIQKTPKVNKFLEKDWRIANPIIEISITFLYKPTALIPKKKLILW